MEPGGLRHGANLLWEEFTRDSPLGLSVVSVEVVQAPESQEWADTHLPESGPSQLNSPHTSGWAVPAVAH